MIVPITNTQGLNLFLNLDNVVYFYAMGTDIVQFHMHDGEIIYAHVENPDAWIQNIVTSTNA